MNCVENTPIGVDSEMEEGEIVDDLSDISSEEEYLLRERLAVLENYNNVLERKKAKCSPIAAGMKHKKDIAISHDLSAATQFENYCPPIKKAKAPKYQKSQYRQNKKKQNSIRFHEKSKDKKKNSHLRKRLAVNLSDTSEESEDDYKTSRKKLADAVVVNSAKNDKSSLSERLQKMFCGVNLESTKNNIKENKTDTHIIINEVDNKPIHSPKILQNDNVFDLNKLDSSQELENHCEIVDICSNDSSKTTDSFTLVDSIDSVHENCHQQEDIQIIQDSTKNLDDDSDDDLELLRQHALKTKVLNNKKEPGNVEISPDNKNLSEEEDSDTAELRLICLRSTILKKRFETKRKQKLQKKLSQSTNIQDDSLEQIVMADIENSNNNTDIESVDMEMGSDVDDKIKENCVEYVKNNSNEYEANITDTHIPVLMVTKEDELEEDEDLLRAKLLTSLSKNLPILVNPSTDKPDDIVIDIKHTGQQLLLPGKVPEEKKFIIEVESDSEGENEATLNLTKMHMKLSDQKDFQQKLDMFLKSTRMEVENTTSVLPDIITEQPVLEPSKIPEKYVVKAVKNLPKSAQMEYRYLLKRMAELEKLKQARQSTMSIAKNTLKPKTATTITTANLSVINILEEKIEKSRKKIAEESAKMLKLKEEGVNLSHKFKMVATELRNVKTAIALNKKEQSTAQNHLTQIRQHHQMLLKSSVIATHSKVNFVHHLNNNDPRFHKNNNVRGNINTLLVRGTKDKACNTVIQKTIKVKDTEEAKQINTNKTKPQRIIQHPRLSVEVDFTNNTKCVTLTDEKLENDKCNEENKECPIGDEPQSSNPVVEKGGGSPIGNDTFGKRDRRNSDDYKSPLDAFGSTTWSEDPNAILCPFDVCGDCKDADCKYLHTNIPSK